MRTQLEGVKKAEVALRTPSLVYRTAASLGFCGTWSYLYGSRHGRRPVGRFDSASGPIGHWSDGGGKNVGHDGVSALFRPSDRRGRRGN